MTSGDCTDTVVPADSLPFSASEHPVIQKIKPSNKPVVLHESEIRIDCRFLDNADTFFRGDIFNKSCVFVKTNPSAFRE